MLLPSSEGGSQLLTWQLMRPVMEVFYWSVILSSRIKFLLIWKSQGHKSILSEGIRSKRC